MTEYAVIFMHGLGDQGRSWTFLKGELSTYIPGPTKWLFPDAPTAPVSVNGGYPMPSWFDMDEIPVLVTSKDNMSDIADSVARIHDMVRKLEADGVSSERIIVGGFSQGGCVALQAVFSYPKPLAGCICLSGWLADRDGFWARISAAQATAKPTSRASESDDAAAAAATASGDLKNNNKGVNATTPVFWGHGMSDDKVTFALQAAGAAVLEQAEGARLTLLDYAGLGHSCAPQEISDLADWVADVVEKS